jgi:hypothetical protein
MDRDELHATRASLKERYCVVFEIPSSRRPS